MSLSGKQKRNLVKVGQRLAQAQEAHDTYVVALLDAVDAPASYREAGGQVNGQFTMNALDAGIAIGVALQQGADWSEVREYFLAQGPSWLEPLIIQVNKVGGAE